MATPTALVGYLALFVTVGILFLLVTLLAGRLLRPSNPNAEKQAIYECGEPAIGSAFVQFDLRFYVVALVFIVFDVEVAFLFPLATVFGKATNLADPRVAVVSESESGEAEWSPTARAVFEEMGVRQRKLGHEDPAVADAEVRRTARSLAVATFWAILVFFIVLLVGFAYEWKTGAFEWVRALSREPYPDGGPSDVALEQA